MNVLVCLCGLEANWWWLNKEFCIYKGTKLWTFHILLIFELLLSKFNKWFLSDKSSEVFWRWSYANVFIVTGDGLQNDFFCRKPRCLLFLEECWMNCFIRHAIKRSMIMTFNQEFTAFNEPMFLFLFNWCLIFCLNFPS